MTDHPSTYKGNPENVGEIDWDDRAAICLKVDHGGKAAPGAIIRKGTFAEMINHLLMLDQETRDKYVIRKAGDRVYLATEAITLARYPDFPKLKG